MKIRLVRHMLAQKDLFCQVYKQVSTNTDGPRNTKR